MASLALPPCLAIAGHHRSGTSLITSMLQSAGVHVGTTLLGPTPCNRPGHFEDVDFVAFHADVLREQGLHPDGFVDVLRLGVPDSLRARALELAAARRALGRCWAWKDPRTTLFIDFWAELLPELRFLFLFRPPWEVIDSLFRRGDAVFRQEPDLAARVWVSYNQAVLAFQERYPSRCLLLESLAAAHEPDKLREGMERLLDVRIRPAASVFQPDLFRRLTSPLEREVTELFFPEAVELYERLRERAWARMPASVSTPAPLRGARQALRHWADARFNEGKAADLAAKLDKARAELSAVQQELKACRQQVAWMERSRWWRARACYHGARVALGRIFSRTGTTPRAA
jgi:hypothetical protein